MNKKTLEATLREKIATGYDPVTLNVGVRSVNEENLEVLIEGVKFSVNGNTVTQIYNKKDADAPQSEGVSGSAASGSEAPAVAGGDAAGDEGSAEEDDVCLLGSSIQPATFALKDGTTLQLGEIVRRAFVLGGCGTARRWNELVEVDPAEAERLIQLEVNALDLAVVDDTGTDGEETSAG